MCQTMGGSMCCSRQLAPSLEGAQQPMLPQPLLRALPLHRLPHRPLLRWPGWQLAACLVGQQARQQAPSRWRRRSCRVWQRRPAQPRTTKSEGRRQRAEGGCGRPNPPAVFLLAASRFLCVASDACWPRMQPNCSCVSLRPSPSSSLQVGPTHQGDLSICAVQGRGHL